MQTFDIKKSPIRKVYMLLNAAMPDELYDKYLIQDQKLVTSKKTNYHDTKLVTNKVKKVLEKVDARKLLNVEQIERRHILWLWYHHAISYAVWGYKDKKRAQKYALLALKYQPKNHSNKITRLLYLLVHDRLSEAEKWTKANIKKSEKKTASRLIKFYKKGGFFK